MLFVLLGGVLVFHLLTSYNANELSYDMTINSAATTTTTTTTTTGGIRRNAAAISGISSSGLDLNDEGWKEEQELIRRTFAALNNDDVKSIMKPFTMVGPLHIDLALNAIQKLNDQNIDGAIVECGVWKGGVSMGMMMVNLRHNTEREFYLFDTFDGLPEPTDDKNGKHAQKLFEAVQTKMADPNATVMFGESVDKMIETRHIEKGVGSEGLKWNYGAESVVRNNMNFAGYPPSKIHLVKGKVEDTLSVTSNLPDKIALLRLDTDWYESTRIEMEVLFERLQPGGLLAVDDFCHWDGSRIAVQEYFATHLGLNYTRDDGLKMVPCFHYWKPK